VKGWRTQGLILMALIASLAGCQTSRSWDSGCPGLYSGVRFFANQQGSLPWDGKIFFMLDLPLTVVMDTVLLPVSSLVDPQKPPGGWVPGCRWAK
jgi:uncharacterized protein YceK